MTKRGLVVSFIVLISQIKYPVYLKGQAV